jgi:thiamine pyrophosphate-dependent acetolactate synthase large subunit-like protein
MAKGMLAMSEEISTEAVADFDVVLAVGQDLGDKDTLAIANF